MGEIIAEDAVTAPALDSLFERLRGAVGAGDAARAEREIWLRWMESGDARADGHMRRGVTAMAGQDYAAALSAFGALVEVAPHFAEGWNKRATVHWLMGNHEASVRDIESTLSLEPRHFGALSGLAMIHEANGRTFEALDALDRLAEIHPQLPQLREWTARLMEGLAEAT